jgi:hypothetical protein
MNLYYALTSGEGFANQPSDFNPEISDFRLQPSDFFLPFSPN